MRWFGGGDEETKETRLATAATGESVTADRLTATERGFGKGRNYLANSSVMDWLEESEQPHFVFPTEDGAHHIERRGASDLEPNGEYRIIIVITTERVRFVIGDEDGDRSHAIRYGEISGVGFTVEEPGEDSSLLSRSVATLKIDIEDDTYLFQSTAFEEDMETAAEYILDRSANDGSVQSEFETPNSLSRDPVEAYTERLEKATNNPTSSGPEPIYSGTGNKVRIEGNTKQRENCGGVEVWDDKIRVQKKGMINRSWITIPIEEIQSVDSTTFGKVSIVTDANDYTISLCSIDTQLVNHVKKWKEGSNEGSNDESNNVTRVAGISAAEEIEKFAELNERGVITDEEFEQKKQELL